MMPCPWCIMNHFHCLMPAHITSLRSMMFWKSAKVNWWCCKSKQNKTKLQILKWKRPQTLKMLVISIESFSSCSRISSHSSLSKFSSPMRFLGHHDEQLKCVTPSQSFAVPGLVLSLPDPILTSMVPIKNFCDRIWNSCGFLDPSSALGASFSVGFFFKKENTLILLYYHDYISSSTYLPADTNKNFGQTFT